MGVEPYLLASSLLGVLAQRLVRKLCPECKRAYAPAAADLAELGEHAAVGQLYAPGGCSTCHGSGYAGRTGVYELLVVDAQGKRLIHAAGGEQPLRDHARAQGMQTLREDGMRWVRSGTTSLEELVRVTRES
jgi:general secretion pathway protein E